MDLLTALAGSLTHTRQTEQFPYGLVVAKSAKRRMNPDHPPPPQHASSQTTWLSCAVLAILVVSAYANSLNAPFIFDDVAAISQNDHLRRLWPLTSLLTAPPDTTVTGRPLVGFSLALNYAVGGLQVWGYHLTNLLIHFAAGCVLFGLLRRTLWLLGERLSAKATEISVIVAALWLVHPLQTEAVTYVVQRTELLMGLCYLLTLYAAARASTSPHSAAWSTAAALCCALGMASKEVMASAPLVVALYDRTFLYPSWGEAWRRRRILYAGLASTWLVLIGLMLGAPRSKSVGFHLGTTWWEYLRVQCLALMTYLKLTFWPVGLCMDYGRITQPAWSSVVCGAALIMTLLAITAWALWRRPRLGFLGAACFLVLAPSSSVVPIVTEPIAERRMYLPLAAIATLVVLACEHMADRWSQRDDAALARRWSRWLWRMAASAAVGLLAWLTFARNFDYATTESIWRDTVAKQPGNVRAHYNLGVLLAADRRNAEAIEQYRAALEQNPDDVDSLINLGSLLTGKNRYDEAVLVCRRAAQLEPARAEAHHNLALALTALGQLSEAIDEYREALRLDDRRPETHLSLADALLRDGQDTAAVVEYQRGLDLQPDDAVAHSDLGVALDNLGRQPEAIEHFRRAIELRPDFAMAHFNLGNALAKSGRLSAAADEFQRAMELDPEDAQARRNYHGVLQMIQAERSDAARRGALP